MSILGIPIITTPHLPPPSHREDARRMVRHGLADVLRWLGEPVGPKPGEKADVFLIGGGRSLLMDPATVARIKNAAL